MYASAKLVGAPNPWKRTMPRFNIEVASPASAAVVVQAIGAGGLTCGGSSDGTHVWVASYIHNATPMPLP